MRIKISDEQRSALIQGVQALYAESFDEEIGELKPRLLIDFFVKALGPHVYNQAVEDSVLFLQDKLVDLEAEIYEPEDSKGRD